MTSFNHNHLCNVLVSKYRHVLRYWGLGFQHLNLEGHNSAYEKGHMKLVYFTDLITQDPKVLGLELTASVEE